MLTNMGTTIVVQCLKCLENSLCYQLQIETFYGFSCHKRIVSCRRHIPAPLMQDLWLVQHFSYVRSSTKPLKNISFIFEAICWCCFDRYLVIIRITMIEQLANAITVVKRIDVVVTTQLTLRSRHSSRFAMI
jgi:hypothetical protein